MEPLSGIGSHAEQNPGAAVNISHSGPWHW